MNNGVDWAQVVDFYTLFYFKKLKLIGDISFFNIIG